MRHGVESSGGSGLCKLSTDSKEKSRTPAELPDYILLYLA